MKKVILNILLSALPLAVMAQTSFDDFRKKQQAEYNQFKKNSQAEYDAFRKRMNEEYAEFMRQTWEAFPGHEAEKPVKEKTLPPVVYEEPEPQPAPAPAPQPQPIPQPDVKPALQPQPKPIENPKPVQIAVKPKVQVVPQPQPAPEPIAPVKPKEEPYKKVSVGYFGTIITVGFPMNDNLKLRALNENAIADAWKQLSDSKYDITVSTVLNARKANALCDWAYMKMLQAVAEKQYGKTNEAVLAQAFLMVQSGYRVRMGMSEQKLYMLVASQYDIFDYNYYVLDGTKFYNVSGDKNVSMQITQAKYDKERSLSLQLTKLPQLGSDPTPKRTLTSKKGVTASSSVNKNMIDFFNTYPQACFGGDQTTRWAAYANTPMEKSVKDMLYPPLKKTIGGMNERDVVGILLNWVQTAFEYGYDDQIWGGDRAFFAQETLYYPYCDCEDRAILFSRLVRDLVGLDVVLLYYPGHLATAVAFSGEVNGDYLTYKGKKYVVCDPTYINAGVGRTMPGHSNKQAQVIALK
ncbi:MAG: hypothetical protein IJT12_06430 [Paludibacteraceae bacterium]|nr:hypothetical protein [Paludibacteraceae bacterium]